VLVSFLKKVPVTETRQKKGGAIKINKEQFQKRLARSRSNHRGPIDRPKKKERLYKIGERGHL
jgi:hypothetical protein